MNTTITKIESAKNQLITAVNLYFNHGDNVSIHTLSNASHEILDNVCKSRGLEGGFLFEGLKNIKPELRNQIFKKVNEAKNFFKHADKDPNGQISWNPEVTEYFIWDSVSLYRKLTNTTPCEMLVFQTIFRIKHSDLWEDPSEIDGMIDGAKLELKNIESSEYYNHLLKECKNNTRKI